VKIYQFIKYNQETNRKHIKHYGKKNLIVCFDFEDGIQNGLNEKQSEQLKERYRDYFFKIAPNIAKNSKIGVRLNAKNISELHKDLLRLKTLDIHSVFLPKIENTKELVDCVKIIDRNDITYREIIPIIENKTGLENIYKIIKLNFVNNIAFGHCDYNLSLNIFPFFHQESHAYWKWVNKIVSKINDKNICFINSPFLSMQKLDFFCSMLAHLETLTNNHFGQTSLSNFHTEICFNYSECSKKDFPRLLKNRLQFYPTKEIVKETIDNYKKYNNGLGLTKKDKRIISYQEYIAAKNYLKNSDQKSIHLTFVGGCFPVQHNILYEDIFLTQTRDFIETTLDIKLNIDIVRYERFTKVMEKIRKANSTKSIDVLIFSIRPEPFLRIIKFYYKYINNEGKLKRSLNLPFFNIINPEKYDILNLGRRYDYRSKNNTSNFHKFLVNMNYLMGCLIRNHFYAINKYLELVYKVEKYCKSNAIKPILLGPNLRSKYKIEPYLCRKLDHKMKDTFLKSHYINGLDTIYKKKRLFHNDGVHVNELYHEMIAKRLNTVLKDILMQQETHTY